jgi:hypothetical protein
MVGTVVCGSCQGKLTKPSDILADGGTSIKKFFEDKGFKIKRILVQWEKLGSPDSEKFERIARGGDSE